VRRSLLTLLLLAALSACAPKAPKDPGSVDLDSDAEWFGKTADDPGAQPPVPGQPGAAAAAPVGAICGEVRLSPDVADAQPSNPAAWWIIIYARAGSPDGPVVAGIKGHLPPKFPLKFCLTSKNSIAGAPFTGSLFLNARIDGDGEPELDPGDFDGTTPAPVPVGARDAVVTIDTFR
jgi:hypothetical protein